MRSMLNVKWRILIAVVGVLFLSLVGFMILTRYQAGVFVLEKNRELVREMGELESFQQGMLVERAAIMAQSIGFRALGELEITRQRGTPPDLDRIAVFIRTNLENSDVYIRGLSLVIKPGVFPTAEVDPRFITPDGYTLVSFVQDERNAAVQFTGSTADFLPHLADWLGPKGETVGRSQEPYRSYHPGSQDPELHENSRVVMPLLRDGAVIGVTEVETCITGYWREQQRRVGSFHERGTGIMLVSHDGKCIGVPEHFDLSTLVRQGPDVMSLPQLRTDIHPDLFEAIRKHEPYGKQLRLGGELVYASITPIEHNLLHNDWSIIVFQREDALLANSLGFGSRQAGESILLLIGAVIFGVVVAQMVSRSVVANENWHRAILDRVPMPLGIIDTESRWEYVNSTMGTIMGWQTLRMKGVSIHEVMRPNEAAFIAGSNNAEAAAVENADFDTPDGSHYAVSSCKLLDLDNNYLGRLVIGVDMTNAMHIQQTLEQSAAIASSLDAKAVRLQAVAEQLSEGAMEKSAAIEEITSTMSQIGATSVKYAESAQKSHEMAEGTAFDSGKSAADVVSASAAMSAVQESGKKVANVIKLIEDIAFQTNLLSLNAAVEAARAGRHGKGFAVVAEEVRNFAGRSAKAAKETTAMVLEMSAAIGSAAESIQIMVQTLDKIRDNAQTLSENSDEVAQLAGTQSVGVRQVHASLEQINQNVNATIAISREAAMVAESIKRQASMLHRLTHEKRGREQLRVGEVVRKHSPQDEDSPTIRLGGNTDILRLGHDGNADMDDSSER